MLIRNTKQRRVIHEVLTQADRPLSVGEILHAAQKQISSLGIATVYCNVKSLVEDGDAVGVDLPGESPRYELTGKGHHHHFRCSSCFRVFDTKACLAKLRDLVPRQFEITGHEIILYGRCPRCRTKAQTQ